MKKLFFFALIAFALFGSALFAQVTAPTVDFSQDKDHHVVIAAGTEDVYQGHPYSVMMPDGKTIFVVWCINHGGHAGPLAKSTDGGLTWTRMDEHFPKNIENYWNCPSIFRLVDKDGKAYLWVLAAYPRMPRVVSEDEGETWRELEPLGFMNIMTFSTIIPKHPGVQDGCYLGFYHMAFSDATTPQDGEGGRHHTAIMLTETTDAGFTWSEPRQISTEEGRVPCEPCAFWSPDKKEIAVLIREENHIDTSRVIFSQDEGKTWTDPQPTAPDITGDRHIGVQLADGRYFFAFRDMAYDSPTHGHFVGWLGTYDDIKNSRPGQCRVKLLHNYAGSDCGYPGIHQLADGTVIALTYVKYDDGPTKHSVVEVRFKPEEVDQRLAEMNK